MFRNDPKLKEHTYYESFSKVWREVLRVRKKFYTPHLSEKSRLRAQKNDDFRFGKFCSNQHFWGIIKSYEI